jgi:hypothetical protein
MDSAGILYLGVTVGLFAIFAIIVIRAMSRRRKDVIEAPKYRMLDDD